MINFTGMEIDQRQQKNGWAPGTYLRRCSDCNVWFGGDKRAITCANCAYKDTSEKPQSLDPKGDAGKQKPQLQLIPSVFNNAIAGALAHGASKYGPWNWRGVNVEAMTYIGAMRRHIDRFLDGEDIDPESGFHHLGHIAASCAILLDAAHVGTLADNRPRFRVNGSSDGEDWP